MGVGVGVGVGVEGVPCHCIRFIILYGSVQSFIRPILDNQKESKRFLF